MTPKRPGDPNQLAKSIIDIATGGEARPRSHARRTGQDGGCRGSGSRGGKPRAKLLSPQERQEIARKAAKTRWGASAPPGKEEHQ